MKKPVMPKGEAFEAILAKRKKKQVTIYKSIPLGPVITLVNAASDFAIANQVPTTDVKITRTWTGPQLSIKRLETDVEFRKRVEQQERDKYHNAKWKFDNWVRQQAEEEAQIAAAAARLNRINELNNKKTTSKSCCGCCGNCGGK